MELVEDLRRRTAKNKRHTRPATPPTTQGLTVRHNGAHSSRRCAWTRSCTTSTWFFRRALAKASSPHWSLMATSAFWCMSRPTMATWPIQDAKVRGVCLLALVRLTSAFCSSKCVETSTKPSCAANSKGVMPSCPGWLGSASCSSKSLATSTKPWSDACRRAWSHRRLLRGQLRRLLGRPSPLAVRALPEPARV